MSKDKPIDLTTYRKKRLKEEERIKGDMELVLSIIVECRHTDMTFDKIVDGNYPFDRDRKRTQEEIHCYFKIFVEVINNRKKLNTYISRYKVDREQKSEYISELKKRLKFILENRQKLKRELQTNKYTDNNIAYDFLISSARELNTTLADFKNDDFSNIDYIDCTQKPPNPDPESPA